MANAICPHWPCLDVLWERCSSPHRPFGVVGPLGGGGSHWSGVLRPPYLRGVVSFWLHPSTQQFKVQQHRQIGGLVDRLHHNFWHCLGQQGCSRLLRATHVDWLCKDYQFPADNVNFWVDFEEAFVRNFIATYKRLDWHHELAMCVQKPISS